MKKNVGSIDKVIRILLAAVMIVLVAMHVVSGVVAIIIGVLAAVFLLTSLVSVCPLYLPFGISTAKK
jgi:hypothetical protein